MEPFNLKTFGQDRQILIEDQKSILSRALEEVERPFVDNPAQLKQHFDSVLMQAEQTAYRMYLEAEADFGGRLFREFVDKLRQDKEIQSVDDVGPVLGQHFETFDRFFLSLAQSRKSKAGRSFEFFHNELFKRLGYPFDEQEVLIDSKPDFLMPSADYYRRNPLGSVVFTAKRTLRERWRQITTEGNRGIGLYLATIDTKISRQQLEHMQGHRIFVVCPEAIRADHYPSADNVISFARFFEDHLDPKLAIWRREGVV